MNYAAINAKLKAMNARRPIHWDQETVIKCASNICRYVPGKLHKDYITAMALATIRGRSLHYYTTQWKRLNRLDKFNRIALRCIMGAEIDLYNILWMYRLKRYHRVTGDGTFGYLVPIRYKLSRETTRQMADTATPEALLNIVANGPYSTDFKHLGKGPEILSGGLTPEQMLEIAIARRYQSAARRYPNSLAPALAYLYRR